MQTFKQVVKSVAGILTAHPVGQQAHVRALWNSVKFNPVNERQTENDAVLHQSSDSIALYPALQDKTPSDADTAVLREFGRLILRKAGSEAETRWKNKLVLPKAKQVESVQNRLQDERVRAENDTYAGLVETFVTAMDRLVALNISNALLANGVRFNSSANINILEWGPTAEYSNLRKYHSIIPFTSAYAPRRVHVDYGDAFAEMIVNKMRAVKEASTALALEGLIREIADQAR